MSLWKKRHFSVGCETSKRPERSSQVAKSFPKARGLGRANGPSWGPTHEAYKRSIEGRSAEVFFFEKDIAGKVTCGGGF